MATGLIVQRKTNERVFIGDDISVTVIECRSGSVRMLIDAPRDMPIVRDELVDDSALRAKRAAHVLRLREQLAKSEDDLRKIQGTEADIADIGRRISDEAANGYIPPGCMVIPDAV